MFLKAVCLYFFSECHIFLSCLWDGLGDFFKECVLTYEHCLTLEAILGEAIYIVLRVGFSFDSDWGVGNKLTIFNLSICLFINFITVTFCLRHIFIWNTAKLPRQKNQNKQTNSTNNKNKTKQTKSVLILIQPFSVEIQKNKILCLCGVLFFRTF